ncbi:hypothetical protein ANCDUO_17553 [Ancylostoma duodenale]|uniref:Tc1-like transposase DDE domain-containing protein n=1 Tax=Ancylostoma duodenale TaxID=51022 RepID=A0A0C2G5M3_9BILA|nr:hypothetical protein ANCDUO_17553 [Ancylostoma duodenale]
MESGLSTLTFTGVLDGLTKMRTQKMSPNPTYSPKGYALHLVEHTWRRVLGAARRWTADVCIELLRNLKANFENARPQLHEFYFHHDNARPHIERTTNAELIKFGWTTLTTLPHPPYSPHPASSDYHRFPISNVI